jgi:hypothetical protein
MRRNLLAVFCALGLLGMAFASEKLAIHLPGSIVQRDAILRVSCHVPRDERNRALALGIADETRSVKQLDGASAPITTAVEFRPGTCGENVAYCAVYRTNEKNPEIVKQTFLVIGVSCTE